MARVTCPRPVVSATAARLEVVVPANAVNANLRVVVRGRHTNGPSFATGDSGPPPAMVIQRRADAPVREHPALGAIVDLQRLLVRFDPRATRSQVDSVAQALGGVVSTALPDFNEYTIDFNQVHTLQALDTIKAQLAANPLVEHTIYNSRLRQRQAQGRAH